MMTAGHIDALLYLAASLTVGTLLGVGLLALAVAIGWWIIEPLLP